MYMYNIDNGRILHAGKGCGGIYDIIYVIRYVPVSRAHDAIELLHVQEMSLKIPGAPSKQPLFVAILAALFALFSQA